MLHWKRFILCDDEISNPIPKISQYGIGNCASKPLQSQWESNIVIFVTVFDYVHSMCSSKTHLGTRYLLDHPSAICPLREHPRQNDGLSLHDIIRNTKCYSTLVRFVGIGSKNHDTNGNNDFLKKSVETNPIFILLTRS